MINLNKIIGFEWNIDKSYKKHDISPNAAEEVFLDEKVKIEKDIKHQEQEGRSIAIGKTTGSVVR